MFRPFFFLSLLIVVAANIQVYAQQHNTDFTQRPRRRALAIEITARVMEENNDSELTEVWHEYHRKVTIPGNPVGIKLVGSNIVVSVQFTPFVRRQGSVLVAQGQIWIQDPQRGMSYYTLIQTIPMEFNEPIYFFPLGKDQNYGSSIEIELTVNQFSEITVTDE